MYSEQQCECSSRGYYDIAAADNITDQGTKRGGRGSGKNKKALKASAYVSRPEDVVRKRSIKPGSELSLQSGYSRKQNSLPERQPTYKVQPSTGATSRSSPTLHVLPTAVPSLDSHDQRSLPSTTTPSKPSSPSSEDIDEVQLSSPREQSLNEQSDGSVSGDDWSDFESRCKKFVSTKMSTHKKRKRLSGSLPDAKRPRHG